MDSLLDETDLAVLGAAIITAAIATTQVSITTDSAIDIFKRVATAIEDWLDKDDA